MTEASPNQVRRVEMILQQLDALPTLSPVAVRLLDLTAAEDTESEEVVKLIGADPALTSKVLKLCRCHPQGRSLAVTSVERAVRLLGFEAVRSAVLSVQVIELFDTMPSLGGEVRGPNRVFDREMFWQHSLAVGIASEMLAEVDHETATPGEAYVSGLLHDLGQLVLHVVLPASFDRVCELSETHGLALDRACQRIIGIDCHTAGKRLAEHWHMPHVLSDVLWLHGQPYNSLPDLPHKKTIGLVSLADALVRRQQITTVGHPPRGEDLQAMCEELGLDPGVVDGLVPPLHEQVQARAHSLGLDEETTTSMLLRSVSRANEVLGRSNTVLRQRAATYEAQVRTLQAISSFHAGAMPSGSLATVMGKVVRSAAEALGGGFFAMIYQGSAGQSWQLIQFAVDGRIVRSDVVESPNPFSAVEDLGDDMQISVEALAILPWLTAYLGNAEQLRQLRLLPLKGGWGVSAVLLHECPASGSISRIQVEALSRTWGAAVTAAAQHIGAKRLGEQLADANRTLLETQDELARSKAMASVGEIAAGAAHEMNNPLAIISGRAQLLAERSPHEEVRAVASQIVEQSHKLSDMVTALRTVADPANPMRRPVKVDELLRSVAERSSPKNGRGKIKLVIPRDLPPVNVDAEQIASAVDELVRNAFEAEPDQEIELRVQTGDLDDRLRIQVADTGPGLTEHALAHAFDPFFSDKPAGRQPGLGLSLARRLIEAHGGRLTLENGPDRGALATIWLDRGQVTRRDVA